LPAAAKRAPAAITSARKLSGQKVPPVATLSLPKIQPLPGTVEVPPGGEDRLHEADEQDLHRHERPGGAGDEDGAEMEAGQAGLAEDVLHVERRSRRCLGGGRGHGGAFHFSE
jgi:hypothetical protein